MSPDGIGQSSRPIPPAWVRATLFCAAYLVSAGVGDFLSLRGVTYVCFWLPAGLYVSALLLSDRRDWPALISAALVANSLFDFLHGTKPALIVLFAFNNTLQALLGAWLFQKFVGRNPALTNLKRLAGLLGFGAVLSTLPAALIGAWGLTYFHAGGPFIEAFKLWWGSCSMAIVVVAPFVIVWFSAETRQSPKPPSPARRLEAVALLVALAASAWYILNYTGGIRSPYKAWLLPLLLWAGVRFGPRGATAATLLLSFVTTFCAARQLNGLTNPQISSDDGVFILQTVLATASLVAIIPAVVLAERDRTLAKLQDNEEHLHNLTEAAFEGIGISERGRVVDVNDQMLKMFGYERDEMIGRDIVDLVAPESREIVAEAIRTGRETIYEHRLLRKDGSSFIAEARARVVHIGNRERRMTALRDVTDRKLSEELNKTQSRVLEKVTRGESLKTVLDDLLRMIEAQSPEMLCSIVLLDPDGLHIRHVSAPSLPPDYINSIDGLAIGPCAGSCGTAAFRRERVFVADIATDPLWADYKQLALPHGLRACWSTPIFDAQRNVLGTFAVYYRSPELPNERHLRLIDTATYTAAVCITKYRADEALHESEDRFRTLVESTPDCIAVAVNERLAYLNPAGLKLIRAKSFAEVAGKSVYDFAPAELRDSISVRRQIVLEQSIPSPVIEFPLLLPDGSSILVESQAVPFVFSGQPAILNLIRDITGRKRAEAERADTAKREQKAREEFTHLLISSQEAERKRIAGELHDSLGQNLSVIKNRARLAAQQCSTTPAATHLQAIERIVSDAIDETRSLAHNLRPAHIEHVGLTASLQEMIREVSQSSEVRFERRVENVDGLFKGEAATNFYRIAQEALNNVIKHSHARQAAITVERDVHSVRLRIADDGVGFAAGRGATGAGLGLTSMTERVRMLGGKLRIESAPGHGTQLAIELPIVETDETAPVEM